MQKVISTNIQLPAEIWQALKIRAAENGTTMRAIILAGIGEVMKKSIGRSSMPIQNAGNLLRKYSGKVKKAPSDAAENHDRTIYDTRHEFR